LRTSWESAGPYDESRASGAGHRMSRPRPSPGRAGVQGAELLGVDDAVGVALLGQEPLSVGGELRVHRVTGDDGVEVRGAPVALGAQHATEALGLLLA